MATAQPEEKKASPERGFFRKASLKTAETYGATPPAQDDTTLIEIPSIARVLPHAKTTVALKPDDSVKTYISIGDAIMYFVGYNFPKVTKIPHVVITQCEDHVKSKVTKAHMKFGGVQQHIASFFHAFGACALLTALEDDVTSSSATADTGGMAKAIAGGVAGLFSQSDDTGQTKKTHHKTIKQAFELLGFINPSVHASTLHSKLAESGVGFKDGTSLLSKLKDVAEMVLAGFTKVVFTFCELITGQVVDAAATIDSALCNTHDSAVTTIAPVAAEGKGDVTESVPPTSGVLQDEADAVPPAGKITSSIFGPVKSAEQQEQDLLNALALAGYVDGPVNEI